MHYISAAVFWCTVPQDTSDPQPSQLRVPENKRRGVILVEAHLIHIIKDTIY